MNTETVRTSPLLAGVLPPLVTPLDSGGALDRDSLARLVEHVLQAGCSGVFVLGTSGEGASFSAGQRTQLIGETVTRVAGRGPVLAGVLEPTTDRVIEQVGPAIDAGADALVVAAPFYNDPSPTELDRHFRLVRSATGAIPVIAYDIPSRVAGTKLSPGLLTALATDGVISGVKDSSGSIDSVRTMIIERRRAGLEQRLPIMTGSEATVDLAIGLGADGCIPGLGNVDPAGFVRLLDLVRSERAAEATAEQERLIGLMSITSVGDRGRMGGASAGIGSFKTALRLLGVLASATAAPPFDGLNDTEAESIGTILAEAGLLEPTS